MVGGILGCLPGSYFLHSSRLDRCLSSDRRFRFSEFSTLERHRTTHRPSLSRESQSSCIPCRFSSCLARETHARMGHGRLGTSHYSRHRYASSRILPDSFSLAALRRSFWRNQLENAVVPPSRLRTSRAVFLPTPKRKRNSPFYHEESSCMGSRAYRDSHLRFHLGERIKLNRFGRRESRNFSHTLWRTWDTLCRRSKVSLFPCSLMRHTLSSPESICQYSYTVPRKPS